MRHFLTFLLAGAFAGAAAPPAQAAGILLQREPGLGAQERAALRADAGVTLERSLDLPRVELVEAAAGERADALAELRAHEDVVWAEPVVPRLAATADARFGELWALPRIDAPAAWQATKGAGALVAVVDSGANAAHPDLAGRIEGGWDYVQDDDTPQDGDGHGTHVAGTIAATENSEGVVGVAPEASLRVLRVLDDTGRGNSADVTAAFDDAGDDGIRVVSASLGSQYASYFEQLAIESHPETLYIVAAGNAGADNDGATPHYPCAYPPANLICVGATTPSDAIASFSNVGATSVDLFAPGTGILSTYSGGYASLQGTSMATPHVSGAAALLFALHPDWSAAQVKRALLDGADRIPALATRSVSGGRLDVAAALALPAAPTAPVTPGPAPTPGPAGPAPAVPAPTPAAPALPAPALPAPAPATPPVAAPAPVLSGLALSGRVRVCAGCRSTARLQFRLAAEAWVTVKVEQRTSTGWTGRGRTGLQLPAGAHRWSVGPRLAGLAVARPGAWRVTLATSAGSVQLRFAVSRR